MQKFLVSSLLFLLAFNFVAPQLIVFQSGGPDCNTYCDENTEADMVEHCKQGCRFAGLAQDAQNLELNSTQLHEICADSCKEAYVTAGKKSEACLKGCDGERVTGLQRQEDLSHILEIAEQEAKKFDMISSFLFSQMMRGFPSLFGDSSEEDFDESREVNVNIPYLNDALDKPNPKDIFDVELEVDVLDNDHHNAVLYEIEKKPSFVSRRANLVTLSFYGMVMAIFLLMFSFTVCFTVSRCMKRRQVTVKYFETGSQESLPPSYENLLKDGAIFSPEFANAKAPLVHDDKETQKKKLEEKINPV